MKNKIQIKNYNKLKINKLFKNKFKENYNKK